MASIDDICGMGFDRDIVEAAVREAGGDTTRALDFLLESGQPLTPAPSNAIITHPTANVDPPPLYSEPAGPSRPPPDHEAAKEIRPEPKPSADGSGTRFDEDMDKAIQQSLLNAVKETVDPTQRVRDPGMPVGLKNVGNTCYFNTLLQGYFGIGEFRKFILQIEVPEPDEKEHAHITFVRELQRLFGFMLMTNRKYVDPSKVIRAMVANSDKEIGGQEDPTEYSVMFLEAVCAGLKAYWEQRDLSDSGTEEAVKQRKFLESLFSAKQVETFTATKTNGERDLRTKETEFNQIIVNISQGNLYAALDDYTSETVIVDYAEEGFEPTATNSVMFGSFPSVLSILVQRMSYDVEKNAAVKLNTAFEFPKTLYVDRYSMENIDVINERRKVIRLLKDRRDILNLQLDGLKRYNGPIGIDEHLRQTVAYVGEKEVAEKETVLSVLGSLLEQVTKEIAACESEVAQITEEVDHKFDDLHEKGYRLHAVLVHDGTALGGHYWAFVYDSAKQVWYKHNDTTALVVDEELMWRESRGGHGNTSAYCLVYVDEKLQEGTVPDSQLVSPFLQCEIAEDNVALEGEIAQWHANAEARRIEAERKQATNTLIDEVKGHVAMLLTSTVTEDSDPRLLSFEHFLLHLGSQDVMQRVILTQKFSEKFPGETLEKTQRMDVLCSIAEELPGVIIHQSAEDKRQEGLLKREFERFNTVADHMVTCFTRWKDDAIPLAAIHICNALKADWDILYAVMRRRDELISWLERLLVELTFSAERHLEAGDWGSGLDEGFSCVTLLAQNPKVAAETAVWVRRRWQTTCERASTVLEHWVGKRTHQPLYEKYRKKVLDTRRMINETEQYAKRFAFQTPDPRVDWKATFPSLSEAFHALRREVRERVSKIPSLSTIPEHPISPPQIPTK